jgi:nucleoid DNA-binding protein
MANRKQKTILKFKDDEFLARLSLCLKENKRVKVTGIGIFELREMKERKIMNPYTRKIQIIPRHNKIGFLPSKTLKNLIFE